MCGIVGAIGERNVLKILLEGLKRLEYRGYDSAGLALLQEKELNCIRRLGKVAELERAVDSDLSGPIGIAHTRWATHGVPSESNAHPHVVGRLALVHNGIIENHESLRAECLAAGCVFHSETDSEVIAHLLALALRSEPDWFKALRTVIARLEGAYGLLVMHQDHPDELLAVRSGSPLVIGLGLGENFIASDSLSLLPVTNRFIYLEEGDVARIRRESVDIFDASGSPVERLCDELQDTVDVVSKGAFKHFMKKEIFEQPEAIAKTVTAVLSPNAFGPGAAAVFEQVKGIKIVACGTSFHAGLVAKYWFEAWAGLPCDVEIASEYRYRQSIVQDQTLFVVISQSGETADTLAALRLAKQQGYLASLAICNVPTSSMVRESDLVFLTKAGVEIGVASTKAFTTQLVGLYGLVCQFISNQTDLSKLKQNLLDLPELIKTILHFDRSIQAVAARFIERHHSLFLGRGEHFPIALEGALKLKEISYIHAEAYPAGELKHGPLALVDSDMPVVVIAPSNDLLEKLKSNMEEVEARGGELLVLTEEALGVAANSHVIVLPNIPESVSAIAYTVPLQLLAYHVACIKGTDVDQPRNLAKSVTVE